MGGFFSGGGSKAIAPFTKQDRATVEPLISSIFGSPAQQQQQPSFATQPGVGGNPMFLAPRVQQRNNDGLFSLFDAKKAQGAFTARDPLENQAAEALGSFNPASFLQGAQGQLGQAGGLFNLAASGVGADPLGARSLFQQFLSPDFASASGPQIDAIRQQSQEFLNQNLQNIGAGAQRASGGVGRGTAEQTQNRLATNRAADLFSQQLLGEQARRQGVQLAAGQQALGQGLREASLLGQLGQGLGALGQGQFSAGLGGIGALADLGGRFQGREVAAQQFPLQTGFQLANLLKAGVGSAGPSPFQNLLGLAGATGSLLGGIGLLNNPTAATSAASSAGSIGPYPGNFNLGFGGDYGFGSPF